MTERVLIQLLGGFSITVTGQSSDFLASKSRKGVSLMEHLILRRGKPVSSQRLIREMWSDKRNDNPENALKTMVSRFRSLLNGVSPGLGSCIVSEQGAYAWQSQPFVQVDVLSFLDELEALRGEQSDDARRVHYRQALKLYAGDLFQTGDMVNGTMYVSWLHKEYLEAVYAYVELLKKTEEYNEICDACEQALRINDLDEHLHIERMRAMVNLNRSTEALNEYRRVTRLNRQYLDAEPSEEMQACYRQLSEAGKTLKFNLDAIRNELNQRDRERMGPFFCDYQAFKEIYNIQMRNLERLGSTMFLGVLMVGDADDEISSVRRESAMAGLQEILRRNLRKGDIVTRFSPSIFAMLLPTVNYSTGNMVMERIEHLFYQEYPSRAIPLHYRISPLGGPVQAINMLNRCLDMNIVDFVTVGFEGLAHTIDALGGRERMLGCVFNNARKSSVGGATSGYGYGYGGQYAK